MNCTLRAGALFVAAIGLTSLKPSMGGEISGKHRQAAELVKTIKRTKFDEQRRAASALGKLGPAALPLLKPLFQAKSWHVREAAALAVETMGPRGKNAVPDLIQLLKDKDSEVRYHASEALRAIGPEAKAAVGPLIALLDDPEEDVVISAGQTLAVLGPDAGKKLLPLIKNPSDRAKCLGAIQAIWRIRPVAKAAITELIRRAIHNRDKEIRSEAMRALGEIGPDAHEAVPYLIRALQKDATLRWRIASTLGMIGPKAQAALPALRRLAKDKDLKVSVSAAFAVGYISEDKTRSKTKDSKTKVDEQE